MGVPGLGDRALPTPLTAGIFRGRQAQVTHELSGGVKAGQIPEVRDDGDRDGTWPPPQGLQGLDHRLKPPGVHLCVERLVETLQTFGGLVQRPAICLEDDVLGRGGTDDVREPAQVGRHVAAVRARMVSSRARLPSRMASSAPWGTETGVRSPERIKRAS